ncbi:MAG: extracellular solute-binding protein [Chloroflexi bacterium]|nr:extracellular solute-binding protein [Chloroflexota bacterium]
MSAKRHLFGLSAITALVLVFSGCTAQAPTAAPTLAPAGGPGAKPGPDALATRVIEDARKEGVVNARLSTSFGIPLQRRLVKEVEEVYGVSLRLEYTGAKNYSQEAATVLAEYKAGISSQDLTVFSGSNMMKLIDAGAMQPVDWLPLLPQGTPDTIVLPGGFGVNLFTAHNGIIYNPRKVAAGEVPRTWRDLADPRWKGRIGITNFPSAWTFLAYLNGVEAALDDLRAIMKNRPVTGSYSELLNRYHIGEIDVSEALTNDIARVKEKGVPGEFASLEFSGYGSHYLLVTRYAQHPNAAKLVAAYLAGPRGFKITLEAGMGSVFYPGNLEHDIAGRNKERGLPAFNFQTDAKYRAFELSPEREKLSQEVTRIFLTGG